MTFAVSKILLPFPAIDRYRAPSSRYKLYLNSMGDDERRVKRSRFDQTEPEPRKLSRFDRRSRSPSSRQQTDSRRSRSPLGKDLRSPVSSDKRSASIDPAAAAGDYFHSHHCLPCADCHPPPFSAAAAAKINAELQARKGLQYADVPPIRSVRNHALPAILL